AYAETGQPDAALADFDRALALDPTIAAAFLGRAAGHQRSGPPPEALGDLRRAARGGAPAAGGAGRPAPGRLARGSPAAPGRRRGGSAAKPRPRRSRGPPHPPEPTREQPTVTRTAGSVVSRDLAADGAQSPPSHTGAAHW